MKARKHRQAIRDGVPQRAECGSAAGSSPIDRARPAPAPQYTAPLPATIPVPLAVH